MTLSKQWDVLGIGCLTVDDLLYIDEFPVPDFKTRVQHSERQGGGLCGVALVAAARSGARCAYGGQLGSDQYSRFIADTLTTEGVDLGPVTWRPEASPFHSTIIVDTVNNTRNIFFEKFGEVGPAPGFPLEATVAAARVLHMDHYGGLSNLDALEYARRHDVPVVGDIERTNVPNFEEFFPLIDHLVLSRAFGERLSGETEPENIIRALWTPHRKVVAVTLGEAGSIAKEGDTWHRFPAYPAVVVDTTGCGDVFHGVYAAGLAQGLSIEDRIQRAAAAAAIKAAHRGAMKGIPQAAALDEFVKNTPFM